jgi:hypothetical protein
MEPISGNLHPLLPRNSIRSHARPSKRPVYRKDSWVFFPRPLQISNQQKIFQDCAVKPSLPLLPAKPMLDAAIYGSFLLNLYSETRGLAHTRGNDIQVRVYLSLLISHVYIGKMNRYVAKYIPLDS